MIARSKGEHRLTSSMLCFLCPLLRLQTVHSRARKIKRDEAKRKGRHTGASVEAIDRGLLQTAPSRVRVATCAV